MHLLSILSAFIIIAVARVVALPHTRETKNLPEPLKSPKIWVKPIFKRDDVDSKDVSQISVEPIFKRRFDA
jgi:hypothetical protein